MHTSYIDDLNNLYASRVLIKEAKSYTDNTFATGDGPYNGGAAEDAECDSCNNGAPVRRCLKCDETAEDCQCDEKDEDELVFAKRKPNNGYDKEEDIHDEFAETGEHPEDKASNMAKQNLYRITKMSAMLFDIIPADSNIEPWVADKLSKAADNINSVLGYKDYQEFASKVDHDIEIEEKTEQDLYKSIDKGGETLIGKIKELMRNQPREKVESAVYGMIKMLES